MKYLLLLLLTIPAFSQLTRHSITLTPSGGVPGEVCFKETVANGLGSLCLTASASVGDYSNSKWEGLHLSVNGADSQSIIQDIQGAGQYTSDGFQVANDCPVGSTNWECGALSGAITHGSQTTNAVALRGYIVQSAAGSGTASNQRVKGWGLNTVFADKGFAYGYALNELDFNIDSINTKVVGLSLGGNGTGTISADSVGFVCNTLNTPLWPVCFTTLDGTSSVFMSAGTTSAGNNVGSQPIYFYGRNSGGTNQRGSLKIDANGNTIIEAGPLATPVEFAILANGVVSILGGINVNGASLINSSRQWVPAQFLFATDGSSEIGSSSANRPGTVHVGAGTAGGAGVIIYNGAVARTIASAGQLSLYDNSSVEKIRFTSATGDAIFAGSITVAGCTGCGSAALPVADTTSIVEGSVDATKELRIEVDGFTTATTRVWTAPNANITVAGINLAQTWTAAQGFAAITATSITGGSGFTVDAAGNTEALSLKINAVSLINSSRQWVPTSFLFGTDGTSSIGSSSANRPGTIHVGAGTAGGAGVLVYNGTVARIIANASQISLYNNSSSEVMRLDSSAGNIIFTGALTQTATSRISSGGVFNGASYNVSGTEVISSSRNTNFNNLIWAGQLWGPYTVDTGLSFASSAGKVAYYDTSGVFKGWIPILP